MAVAAVAIAAGCQGGGISHERPEEQADEDARAAMAESRGGAPEDYQTNVVLVDDNMSESHRMMAIMILKGEDMNDDLDSYERVYLVDVKSPDSSQVDKVLVVYGPGTLSKTIVPKNPEN